MRHRSLLPPVIGPGAQFLTAACRWGSIDRLGSMGKSLTSAHRRCARRLSNCARRIVHHAIPRCGLTTSCCRPFILNGRREAAVPQLNVCTIRNITERGLRGLVGPSVCSPPQPRKLNTRRPMYRLLLTIIPCVYVHCVNCMYEMKIIRC